MQCQQCIWKMNKGITGMSGYSSARSLPATWQSCCDMPTSQLHTRGQALASCVSSCLGVKSTPEVISSCATRSYFPQRKQSAKPDQIFHVSQRLWTHGWSRWHMLERLPLIRQKSGHLLDGLNTGNRAFFRCLELNMLSLYEPVSPTITGSASYAVWTLTSGSRGNVSELHICESDALVVLFGHWLTSNRVWSTDSVPLSR